VLAIPILIAANYHQHQHRRLAANNDDIIHFNRNNNNDNNNNNNNNEKLPELSFANGAKTSHGGGGDNVSTNYQNGASNYPVNHGVKPINDEIKSIKRNNRHHRSDLKINWIKHDNIIYRLLVDQAKRVVFVKPIGRNTEDAVAAPSSYQVHEFPYPPPRPLVTDPWRTLHQHPDIVVHELHQYYEATKRRNLNKLGIRSYHQPPNPVLQVLLSHYGKYLPTPHFWGVQGNGLYGYSAGNDLHNNAPNGAYKIVQDYDK
jgi:hypothetical protein